MTSPAQQMLREKLLEKFQSGELTLEQLTVMGSSSVIDTAIQADGEQEATDGAGDADQLIQEIVALIFQDEGAVDLTADEMDQLINDLFEQVEV